MMSSRSAASINQCKTLVGVLNDLVSWFCKFLTSAKSRNLSLIGTQPSQGAISLAIRIHGFGADLSKPGRPLEGSQPCQKSA